MVPGNCNERAIRTADMSWITETSCLEDGIRYVELDPACGFELWVFVVAEVGLFAGVGVFDDVPAVAGEVGAVDDERADGSHAGGLFELVGPAAVVGEGVAAEEVGVGGGWVADDAEDDFAFDVDVGVVVPVKLGGGDAVADEDDGGIDVDGGGERAVGDGVVVAVLEVDGVESDSDAFRLFGDERHGGFGGDGIHADEVDLLEVGAVVAAGFEAVEGELGGDVLGGYLAAAQAGAASFEEIVGEELDVGADLFGVDGGFGCFDCGRDGLGEGAGRDDEEGYGEGDGRANAGLDAGQGVRTPERFFVMRPV